MKKITTAILGTALAFGAVSCKKETLGEGPLTTKTRTVPSFRFVSLAMNGNVYYSQGTTNAIEVTANEMVHQELETYVENEKLIVRYRNGKIYDADGSVSIRISSPVINGLETTHPGNIYVNGPLQTITLLLKSTHSGSIHLKDVQATTLDASVLMSGDISVGNGTVHSAIIKAAASGRVDISGVTTSMVSVSSKGSGDNRVKATDRLDVRLEGSGSVYYRGNPYVTTFISGTGKLYRF